MSNETNPPLPPPGSVLDIVTFGYKAAIKCIWPVTKLILPVLVVHSATTAYNWSVMTDMKAGGHPSATSLILLIASGLLTFVTAFAMLYLYYAIARYIRDVFWDEARENVYTYLIPEWSLMGCLGIGLLWMTTTVPVMIVAFIGLLFLIVPGVAIMVYYYTWFEMAMAVYLGNPQQGVFDSMAETFSLLKGNFWRTVGLGILAWMIYAGMAGVLAVAHAGMQIMEDYSPSMVHTLWFPVLYGVLTGVITWFSMSVGQSGLLFTLYRYYFDLKARAGLSTPIDMAPYQDRAAAPRAQNGN